MQEAEKQTSSKTGEKTAEDEGEELEAAHVYLLLKKDLPISRNLRAEWYLEHLNTVIRVPRWNDISELTKELEVVSIEPFDPPADFDNDTAHEYRYRVTRRTALHCLGHRYRLVYGIDLSPSMCRVIRGQGGEAQVLLQKVHSALADAINGVLQQFYVPGSEILFYPVVYVTILAHTSVFRCDWQLVLVQGWYLMQENLDSFLDYLSGRLKDLYIHLAENTTKLNEERLLQPPPFVSPYLHPSLSHPFNDQSSLDGDSSFDPDQDVSFEQACFDLTNCSNINNSGGRSRFEAVNSSYSSSPVSSLTGPLTRQSSPVRKMLKQPPCNHKSCINVVRYAKHLESLAMGTTTTTCGNNPHRRDGLANKKGGRVKKNSAGGGGGRVGWRSEGSSIAEEATTKGLLESALTPDMSFVNLLRYCVVALQLLPKTSISGIIVLTDGVFCMPDASLFDALLNQVRNMTISISFLHLTEKPKEILEPSQLLSPSLSPPNSPLYQQIRSSSHPPDPTNLFSSSSLSLGVGSMSSCRPPGSLPPLVRDALRNLFSLPDLHDFDSADCEGETAFATVGQEVLQLREELMWRQARLQQKRHKRSRCQELQEARSWSSEGTPEQDRNRRKERSSRVDWRGGEEEKPSSSCLVRRVSWQDEAVLLKSHAKCQSVDFKEKWEESMNVQSGDETNDELLAAESLVAEAFEAEMFSEEKDWDDDWIDEAQEDESLGVGELKESIDSELEELDQLRSLTWSACSLRRERQTQNKSRDASHVLSRILAGSDVEVNHQVQDKPDVIKVSERLFSLQPLGTVSRYTNVSLSSSGLSSAYRPRFTSQRIREAALRAATESSVTHQAVDTAVAAAAAVVGPETRRRLSTGTSVVPPYSEKFVSK